MIDLSGTLRRMSTLVSINNGILGVQLIPNSAYFDTVTAKNGSVTLVSLDALGGPCSDICIQFMLVLDAAATFTPRWYVNTIDAPATFTIQNVPALANIATPGANGVYRYEFPGILAQGMVLEFRVAQDNAGNATNAIEGDLSYWA